ncbi:aldo/keto reductase [Hypericibacter terrae]|uniref:aldo/keto reductase n=1 Tax=Hypericibacter terrae TaxID=2602015 RepID=UPI001245F0A0|nr:aldo/keto reductase [Hypericibacter terrae]
MTNVPPIKLNDGAAMPQLGFGVWQVPDDQAAGAVKTAIASGYRSIDTAAIYGNEEGVGRGIKAAGVARSDLFITTKLWNDRQGKDEPARALAESLKKLKLDYVDLYLIHWPAPMQDRFVDSWRALVALQQQGLARSIGVSNFTAAHLTRIIDATGVVPAVNQIELHPRLQQKPMRDFHATHGIRTESWSPLGQGKLLDDPVLAAIAKKYTKSTAQVILRWHLDNQLIAIPKSTHDARIRENFALFDFKLEPADLAQIDKLDANGRIGPDPDRFS